MSTKITERQVVACIANRSTIVLNLRRVQQGKPPVAVTNGLINPMITLDPANIDAMVTTLSRLRFSYNWTEEQGTAILAAMRDYFAFAVSIYAYAELRRSGKPANPDKPVYETLYAAMRKD